MSVRTVGDDECAACDADKHKFTAGQAYVAGLVLAYSNGPEYVVFEVSSFCERHRKLFERNRTAIELEHAKRLS